MGVEEETGVEADDLSIGEIYDTVLSFMKDADGERFTDEEVLQEVALYLNAHGFPKPEYPRSWYSEQTEKMKQNPTCTWCGDEYETGTIWSLPHICIPPKE